MVSTLLPVGILAGAIIAAEGFGVASAPIVVLCLLALVGGARRRRHVRRVTWGDAIREGSPDSRRRAAVARLARRRGVSP
jgi:hypothetical protein